MVRLVKPLKPQHGEIEVVSGRDRNSRFEPEIVKKRETILADSLQDRIIGMYGLGMSLRDISAHIKEMYDTDISHDTLSTITERIMPLDQGMAKQAAGRTLLHPVAGRHALQG